MVGLHCGLDRTLQKETNMGIRRYNPTSPGRRGATVSDFLELTPGAKPEKSLLRPKRRTGGRNNQGKITARFRGGGHKRDYRIIDFRRDKDGVPAKVDSIQYDPNRTARIALLHYVDGEKRYILAPVGLKAGDKVHERAGRPGLGRQCPAAGEDSHRHDGPQYRNATGSRRGALPFGRRGCHVGRPRCRLGPDQPA